MSHDHPLIERLRRTVAERGLLTGHRLSAVGHQSELTADSPQPMAVDLPTGLTADSRQPMADCGPPPRVRVLAAVSGGPDSLALLHALHSLQAELRIELVAAHLNHLMRGAAGDEDADFVRETADAWGIPVERGFADVPALARRTGLSLEEAGRAARYRFFGRAVRRAGCTAIATGHTADDRVETVLLHLFRGTGLDGLAGIPARRPLRPGQPLPEVIRPLIDVTRAEVLDYCAAHHLQPRYDATNASPDFLRNRLRRELLPLLEADYAPALRRHLLHLADLAQEETALLNEPARALLEVGRAPTPCPPPPAFGGGGQGVGASTALSRSVLLAAPPALARRALRLAVQDLLGGPPPELAVAERLLALARGERPGFTLPGGRTAVRATGEALFFEPTASPAPFVLVAPMPLAVPGITPLPWAGGTVMAAVLGVGGWGMQVGGWDRADGASSDPTPNTQHLTPNTALLDRCCLTGPLTVRPPRPGDRIQPLGMSGHRKLQDLLTDRKVPRTARRRLPVVCDDEKIVWVAGCCLSEAVKITAATTEAVELVWEAAKERGTRNEE